jgi:hypothetical protein
MVSLPFRRSMTPKDLSQFNLLILVDSDLTREDDQIHANSSIDLYEVVPDSRVPVKTKCGHVPIF